MSGQGVPSLAESINMPDGLQNIMMAQFTEEGCRGSLRRSAHKLVHVDK